MLESSARAVAVISYHASPLGELGRGENGGMNLAIRRFCEGLSAAGIPTDVFVRRDDPLAAAEELIAPRSRLVRLTAGPEQPVPKGEAGEHVDTFAAALLDHAASERRRYRLVHAHYWLGGMVAERLRAAWGIPWVQSFHTLAATKLEAGVAVDPGRVEAELALARAADLVIAAGRAEAGDLMRLYGVLPAGVSVVRPGVDLLLHDEVDPVALRAGLGLEDRQVILHVGRLEPLKGADVLVEAVALLTASGEFADVVTLVVGANSGDGGGDDEGGGERGRLERLVAERGISDRVRFLGSIEHEDLPGYYALADVCVMPSRTETFGFVALEAQAMGTPVVAAEVGGLTEVVEDGLTGLLVGSREPQDFAVRIAEVLRDGDLRARMGEEARRRAQTFQWSASVVRLQEVYDLVAVPAEPRLPSLTP